MRRTEVLQGIRMMKFEDVYARTARRSLSHAQTSARRALPGMMRHQDGFSHQWVDGQWWDLIVTMDDATSEIYSGLFVDEKGTLSTFAALDSVIAQKGLFCALYADRGGHYWHTPEADGKVDRDNPTQDGRALIQLGIELIPAYSPEARRRSERMFGTLQKRLPQERRLAGITTMAAVNRFPPRVRDRYSCRSPVPLRIFCASTKSASSATTTRCYYLGRYAADGAQKGKKGQQAA